MKSRSPLHDRTDPQLVLRLVANMKERHEGLLDSATLERDMRLLDEEIAFSDQRVRVLKERCALAGGASQGAHAQAFAELFARDGAGALSPLQNARQFLKAEKLTNEGVPKEQIAANFTNGRP